MAGRIRTGVYRPVELVLLDWFVREGDTVVDAGANYGVWTYHMARAVGPGGTVVAVEAAPRQFKNLTRVLRLLGLKRRVELHQIAVGDEPGTAVITVPRKADGSPNAARSSIAGPPAEHSELDATSVRVSPLDRLVHREAEISFLKIDVEGADHRALVGARGLIERSRPTILVEVAPDLLERLGSSPSDVADLLTGFGYRTYGYDAQSGHLSELDSFEGDVIAVHPSRDRGEDRSA